MSLGFVSFLSILLSKDKEKTIEMFNLKACMDPVPQDKWQTGKQR